MFILLAPRVDEIAFRKLLQYINSRTNEQILLLPNTKDEWELLWPKRRHKKKLIRRLTKHCTD